MKTYKEILVASKDNIKKATTKYGVGGARGKGKGFTHRRKERAKSYQEQVATDKFVSDCRRVK